MRKYLETVILVSIKSVYGCLLFALSVSGESSDSLLNLMAGGLGLIMVIDAYVAGRIIHAQVRQDLEQARLGTSRRSDSRLPKRQ